MKTGYELIEELFGEDFDSSDPYELRDNDLKGFELISDELSYNSGWYNYYKLTFKHIKTGKKYSIEYNSHTSDNVCDGGFLTDTLKEIKEDKTYDAFDKFMNLALDLGNELHEREELTELEGQFLNALDCYIDLACEEIED